MKKVLVLPYWMTGLSFFYSNHPGLIVRIGDLLPEDLNADYIIGFSLGALIVLQSADAIKGQIVLINPTLPKQNLFVWFFAWVKYVFAEGLFLERQHFTKNPVIFLSALIKHVKLLSTDFTQNIILTKDRLTVIRGKDDKFFCTHRAVEFFRSINIKVLEEAGRHNWSEELEKIIF